jgi:hypothetical protein
VVSRCACQGAETALTRGARAITPTTAADAHRGSPAGSGDSSDPTQSAIAAGVATGLGAIVPVIPFMFTTGAVAILVAAGISLVAHFLVGAAKSLVTLRTWWSAGPRDDRCRRDRRRRHLPGRPGVADLIQQLSGARRRPLVRPAVVTKRAGLSYRREWGTVAGQGGGGKIGVQLVVAMSV